MSDRRLLTLFLVTLALGAPNMGWAADQLQAASSGAVIRSGHPAM